MSDPLADQVAALRTATQRIAREGDLSVRVPPVGAEAEIQGLATDFNAAMERVQAMYASLESVLVKQRRFVRDASHELRTPLTTMSSALETMSLFPQMAQEQRHPLVESAWAEAQRMARLIDDLLMLAAFDSGERLRRDHFDWAELAQAAAAEARNVVAPRQVVVEIASDLGAGWGDPNALRQMLARLVANVREHTPANSTMTLRVDHAPTGDTVLSIADDGSGVAPPDLAALTERFVQADLSRTGSAAGLGLAIAHAIASGHGGSLSISSVEPHGLKVTAAFPAGNPASQPERRRSSRPGSPPT